MSRPTSDRPSSSFSRSSNYGITRGDSSKNVRYEIFKRCAEVSDDVEWNSLFKKMSKGIFPEHFRFDGVSLRYTRIVKGQSKTKNERLEIGEEAEEECKRIRNFIYAKSGYRSAETTRKLRRDYKTTEDDDGVLMNKKVNVLYPFLYAYLKQQSELNGKQSELDAEQLSSLVYRIIDLVQSGDLPLSNIVISESEIANIAGLEVKDGRMTYMNLRKHTPCTHVDIFSLSG